MQLFTIGLWKLGPDGTVVTGQESVAKFFVIQAMRICVGVGTEAGDAEPY